LVAKRTTSEGETSTLPSEIKNYRLGSVVVQGLKVVIHIQRFLTQDFQRLSGFRQKLAELPCD
jgi:hypothetical protein